MSTLAPSALQDKNGSAPQEQSVSTHVKLAFKETEKDPGIINGPVLRFARWLSDSVINVAPKNRFMSALGLTLGLAGGYRFMRALTGRDFNGMEIIPGGLADKNANLTGPALDTLNAKIKAAAGMLKSIYGKFDFDYFGNDTASRSKRFVMWTVPAIAGFIGVVTFSNLAFWRRNHSLKNPEFMEDYSANIAMKQSDRWGWLSGISAVFGSSAGFSQFPSPLNYGMTLATRSLGAYDKRVAMPGLNWLWSNNKSSYYQGLTGLLEYTCLYAARNPSAQPKELRPLAEAILRPHFPDVTDAQIDGLVNIVQEVRTKHLSHHWQQNADTYGPDTYPVESFRKVPDPRLSRHWQKGNRHSYSSGVNDATRNSVKNSIPKSVQDLVFSDMHSVLRKEGFEKSLEKIGLHPADAQFYNGVSEKVANALGAKKTCDLLRHQFQAKAEARARLRVAAMHRYDSINKEFMDSENITSTHFRDKVVSTSERMANLLQPMVKDAGHAATLTSAASTAIHSL